MPTNVSSNSANFRSTATTKRVLLADVGATNARFALAWISGASLSEASIEIGPVTTLATQSYESASLLISFAVAQLGVQGELASLAGACFLVAGPVDAIQSHRLAGADRSIGLTNGGLSFGQKQLSEQLGISVIVENDFFGIAQGLNQFSQLVAFGEGKSEVGGVKAVLGPGSGLGVGLLINGVDGNGLDYVLRSEGGHASITPTNPLEMEILGVLAQNHTEPVWETILSGPGLVNLYRTMCNIWGERPQDLTAEQISANGCSLSDPVCHQTLEVFFGFLGSAAGNLAVTVCATGGIYIAGGIVPKLMDFSGQSTFRRHFCERGLMSGYVSAIPTYVICDEHPGLIGAAAVWQRRMLAST